jgi:hypothetical protein
MSEKPHIIRNTLLATGFATLAALTTARAGETPSSQESSPELTAMDPDALREYPQLQITDDVSVASPNPEEPQGLTETASNAPVQLNPHERTPAVNEPAPIKPQESATLETPSVIAKMPAALPITDVDNPLVDTGERPMIALQEKIPQTISSMLRRDTARLTGSGCSASMIRDYSGAELAALTAQHCVDEIRSNQLVGPDGKAYFLTSSFPEAMTGDTISSLESQGTITQIALPRDANTELDVAIAAFDNQDMGEAINYYRSSALSMYDALNLKPGTLMVMSGWPVSQAGNTGELRRQELPLTVLGVGPYPGLQGEHKPLLWAVARRNQDITSCIPGASGSRGAVEVARTKPDGQPYSTLVSAGPLSRYIELDPQYISSETPQQDADYWRHAVEEQFRITLPEDATEVCGFFIDFPAGDDEYQVINLVKSLEEIPGYEDPAFEYEKEVRAYFMDPSTEKLVIDGQLGGRGGSDENGNIFSIVTDRPLLYWDKESGKFSLAWYDSDAEDSLRISTSDISDVGYLVFADRDDEPGAEILRFTGQIFPNKDGDSGFINEQGLTFGSTLTLVNPESDRSFYILDSDANGQVSLVPYESNTMKNK